MPTLDRTLRSRLERTIREARLIAETAARAALGQLGVDEQTVPAHLAEPQRELRRRLRAHGRQLGDALNGDKVQNMDRLVEEVAYEHWHRMLFARFLAANNLLMYPDLEAPVPVTLEECEDLAADEGAANGWELAARFAARMLPQIFRLDSPVFRLTLPPEHQQKLERLLADLPPEVFTASDSLGWVYQFWQTKKKKEVNDSEAKIDGKTIGPVTQLFTEHYMVQFLLHNTLGAWWVGQHPGEDLPLPMEYLRRKEDGTPIAGTFPEWPDTAAELRIIDPCGGSGHFLVAAFEILRATRGGPGAASRHHLLEMNAAIAQLGRLITDDPANDGVAEVIWAALRGVVLVQMIIGAPVDWRAERRALIDMVTHYLQRGSPDVLQ